MLHVSFSSSKSHHLAPEARVVQCIYKALEMFTSNSSGNNDPVAYSDHLILHRHFDADITSDFKQEDPSLSFSNFPSPFYNHFELELEDHDIFLQQHHDLLLHHQTLTADSVWETITNMPDSCKNEESAIDFTQKSHNATEQQTPRQRSSSKKDRHSKINTANGPRDRRMRLSLDVAREFFGLQDMLGYDKASRTVQWLLVQAKQEIMKLARSRVSQMNNTCSVFAAAKSPSSTSEGEVASGIDKAAMEGSISKGTKPSTKEKKVRQPPKTTFRPLARDLREKARARAKARTKEKIMWTQRFDELKLCDDTKNSDLKKFRPWSSFETGEELGIQHHNRNNPPLQAAVAEVKQLSSHDVEHIRIHGDMIDESLAIINDWSPNSMFSSPQNSGINQEHQLTGFLSFGKPWEAYINKNP